MLKIVKSPFSQHFSGINPALPPFARSKGPSPGTRKGTPRGEEIHNEWGMMEGTHGISGFNNN